jgi:hypothetical protein
MWWLLGVILAVPILWFLFSVVAGFTIDPRTSGKALLKKKLAARGLPPSQYSDKFLTAVTDRAVSVAHMMKDMNLEHFNNALVDHLDGCVEQIAQYERGDCGPFDSKDSIVQMLSVERHIPQKNR